MKEVGYYNGKIGPLEEMTVPMQDRALYFGDGIYEATCVANRVPFALDDHLDRMYNSLRLLEMEVGQQKWLEKAQNQTERLKELVNSLVTLSRMDEEESPLKLSDFAVSEAVEETAESFRDFARSQGHLLELAIVPGLTYCGDEYAVRQLVSILLDNAVKYALPETPIRFVLEKGKRGVVLRCSNACTPLAEGETEKLFDRFYRSDQARSADGSFGVGLSIARSIAEGHHGFIRAQCPQPGEIVFTAQLR